MTAAPMHVQQDRDPQRRPDLVGARKANLAQHLVYDVEGRSGQIRCGAERADQPGTENQDHHAAKQETDDRGEEVPPCATGLELGPGAPEDHQNGAHDH